MNYRKAIAKRIKSENTGASAATVALALVGGIAVGAIVSLLFAPQSGEETRGLIADKSREYGDKWGEQFKNAKGKALAEAENLAGKAKDKYESVKSRFNHVKDSVVGEA
ncbi:MAG: YtxH domain-containing protein [Edaphocola sp.]